MSYNDGSTEGKSIREYTSNKFSTFAKALASMVVVTLSSSNVRPSLAATVKEEDFISALATMIEAKIIIKPTQEFVEVQAYDKARTNLQFILNQLQLQKKLTVLIQNSIDFCDDMDAIDAAQEAGNRLTNTVIQYDSTVYTCVFIPTDDGTVPPAAEKYRKQTKDFYNSFNSDIDTLLKVASEEQLSKAQSLATLNLKSRPPVLFKNVASL
mmetsp:Transcript_30042/g.41251  ORF Transcript_30042/g.41251 Transcript_30042/m.41251 type:complete len:211 (+) Transcript_30042:3-635(+)